MISSTWLTANPKNKLEEIADGSHVLKCGKEDAVAATKSVDEHGLFYDTLLRKVHRVKMDVVTEFGEQTAEALTLKIDAGITEIIRKAT